MKVTILKSSHNNFMLINSTCDDVFVVDGIILFMVSWLKEHLLLIKSIFNYIY